MKVVGDEISNLEGVDKRVEELKGHLLNRNYNLRIINKARERIALVSRQEALKRVNRVKEDRKCFITEYHPSLPPMATVLRKHWSVMRDRDKRMREVFHSLAWLHTRRDSH